jgi:hypothetical protein
VIRRCTLAHGGRCSAELARAKSAGDALLADAPDSVPVTAAGATYVASAWVRAPSGRTVRLRLRESGTGGTVRTKTASSPGTGGWLRLTVRSDATRGGTSLGLEVVAVLATGLKAQVDDLSLSRG